MKRKRLWDVWYSVIQGQGPVGTHDVFATPMSWKKKEVKREIRKRAGKHGSVKITSIHREGVIWLLQ